MKTWVVAIVVMILGSAVGFARSWYEFRTYGDHFVESYIPSKAEISIQAGINGPQPKVEVVGGTTHDFGRMDHFTKKSHEFTILNVGDAPLLLQLGRSTCKCTLGELKDGTIPPGGSTKIQVSWKAVNLDPDFQQSAEILTSDPNRPQVELLIRGTVDQRVVVVPEALVFTDISASEPNTASYAIFTTDLPEMAIEEFEFLNPETAEFFDMKVGSFDDDRELRKAMLKMRTNANGGIKLNVTVKPGMPSGPFKQTLRLKTNTDLEPLELPLEGNVISDIVVVGGAGFNREKVAFDFGVVATEEGAETTLYVIVKGVHREKTELAVESVEPSDSLKAALGEPNSTERVITYPLKVTIPKGAKQVNRLGSDQGKLGEILIRTTHPDDKEITVRIRYAVEE